MLERNRQARFVAARFEDFTSSSTPWPRRLWTTGLIATLEDVLIASEAYHAGNLSSAAMKDLCDWAKRLTLHDPAVPSTAKESLRRNLNSTFSQEQGQYYYIQAALKDIQHNYLTRWSQELAEGDPPGHELASRSIIGHLLHVGYSAPFIRLWFGRRIGDPTHTWTLAELVAAADDELVQGSSQDFEVVLPLHRPGLARQSPHWMDASNTSDWMKGHGFSPVRQSGSLRVNISARDAYAAVSQVADIADRLVARGTVLGGGARFLPHSAAWVAGIDNPVKLREMRRVHVGALERIGDPAQLETDPIIDSAIALAAPLQRQSPAAAVAGAWACMEALLSAAGEENVLAADRMASIITCSLPRAEWTSLARRHAANNDDETARQIQSASRNKDKAARALMSHRQGVVIRSPSDSDEAAIFRLDEILASPRQTLGSMCGYISAALRRLYMYRNIVLHGGRIADTSGGLRGTLDITAPLIGAGLDRIVNAWLESGQEPKAVAGKAEYRRTAIQPADGTELLELLE